MRCIQGLVAVCFVAACGGGGDPDVPTIAINDVGDVCRAFADAYCDAGIECELIGASERAACESNVYAACCLDDDSCQLATYKDEDDIAACNDALMSFSCNDLDQGFIPNECLDDGVAAWSVR